MDFIDSGEDGYAYGVPLNYVYVDNSIYFHCAKEGHKLDNIKIICEYPFVL